MITDYAKINENFLKPTISSSKNNNDTTIRIHDISNELISMLSEQLVCDCEISLTLSINNNIKCYISSFYEVADEYVKTGLIRSNSKSYSSGFNGKTYYIYNNDDEIDTVDFLINDFFTQHNLFQNYSIYRSFSSCSFIFTLMTKNKVPFLNDFYNETINKLESFCVILVQKYMNLLSLYVDSLNQGRLHGAKKLIEDMMKERLVYKKIKLTNNDKNILYLSSLGKNSKEIALILGLSHETVATYRKRILPKLGAKNIVHAVKMVMLNGEII